MKSEAHAALGRQYHSETFEKKHWAQVRDNQRRAEAVAPLGRLCVGVGGLPTKL